MRLRALVRGHPVRIALAGLAGVAVWVFVLPFAGSQLGFATRWPLRMPGTVNFQGRDYASPTGCLPRSKTPLKHRRGVQIGSVPEVLGSGVPILETSGRSVGDPAEVALITHPDGNCYVIYSLQGGP